MTYDANSFERHAFRASSSDSRTRRLPLRLGRVVQEPEAGLKPRQSEAPGNAEGDSPTIGAEAQAEGLYIISVAARILEMHPQTLRKYERMGLVTPSRTIGMLRLYSEEDIARLRLIKHLVGDLGLNLAGVQLALSLFNQLLVMRMRLSTLDDSDLKDFLEERLGEMLELLYTQLG